MKFMSSGDEDADGDGFVDQSLSFSKKCSLSDKWLEDEDWVYVTNLKGRYANQNPDP